VLHDGGRALFNHNEKAVVLHRFYSELLGISTSSIWDFDP
jgi:hypothetical protein